MLFFWTRQLLWNRIQVLSREMWDKAAVCCKQSMLLQGLPLADCCHRGVQCAQVPREDSRHKAVSSRKECPSPFSPDAAHLWVSHTGIHFACDIVVYSTEQCASYVILSVFMSFISRPHGSPTPCLVRADSDRARETVEPNVREQPGSALVLSGLFGDGGG